MHVACYTREREREREREELSHVLHETPIISSHWQGQWQCRHAGGSQGGTPKPEKRTRFSTNPLQQSERNKQATKSLRTKTTQKNGLPNPQPEKCHLITHLCLHPSHSLVPQGHCCGRQWGPWQVHRWCQKAEVHELLWQLACDCARGLGGPTWQRRLSCGLLLKDRCKVVTQWAASA